MELTGDEKRIQALFSERSREDAQHAPRFEKLWRAASVAEQTPRFRGSLILKVAAAATAIVVITIIFAVSSRDQAPLRQNARNMAPQPIASPTATRAAEPENKVAHLRTRPRATRRRTLARRQQRELVPAQQAALLANWKSPTEKFLTSPTSSVFNSLPQLNESVKELQAFLSTDESSKESNQ